MVSLYVMNCGTLRLPKSFLIEGGEGEIEIPVPGYLIRHPKGDVIFDTGLELGLGGDLDDLIEPARVLRSSMAQVGATPYLEPSEDVASRLKACDVDPGGIRYLVNSHLHFDHCGGNALIPNAQLVVQKREWAAGCSPECQHEYALHPYEYDLGHDRLEIDGEHDLFGDGTVTCIPSFGHTPGHQSLRVRLDDGDVVLTGDACYLRQTLEQMRLPGFVVESSREQMMENLRLFRKLQNSGAYLVFGHDADQWRGFGYDEATPLNGKMIADVERAAAADTA